MTGADAMSMAIFLLATLPFLLVTVWLVRASRKGTHDAQEAQAWPVVTGEILVSDVRVSTSTDSDGSHSTAYYPDVAYAYSVGGHDYRGHTIAPGPEVGAGTRARAAQMAARYPVGARVQVHYDPVNPARAVLELDSRASKTLMWISGCIVAFVIFMAIAMWLVSQAIHRAVGGLL